MKYIYTIGLLILSIAFFSCMDNENNPRKVETATDSAEVEEVKIELPEKIEYKLVYIQSSRDIDSILSTRTDSLSKLFARKILMTLNRKELRFVRAGESIVVPNVFTDNILDYSIFPSYYPEAKDISKLIIVDIPKQAYACYENGKAVRFAAVNSGKERTPSFPGRYSLVWKSRLRRSSLDSTWVLPFTFNFHSEAGSAFHKFSMPGRPVSHSCLRQFMDDSEWLYNWGQKAKQDTSGRFIPFSGTPVIVLGYFDYSRPKSGPWHELQSNHDGIVELPKEPLQVEEALIPIIQIPRGSRSSLRNRALYDSAESILRSRGIIREGVQLTPTFNFNDHRRKLRAAEAKKKQAADSNKTVGGRLAD